MKYRKYISILIFIAVFSVPLVTLAQGAPVGDFTHNTSGAQIASPVSGNIFGGLFDIMGMVISPLVLLLLQLTGFLTMLSGVILNGVIHYTITLMAENFHNIPAIDVAWGVIRDVANMGFIFVLLFASLQMIMGEGKGVAQRLIVNIIIAAILINFSLFFTKFVIDIANLLALTFYHAIAPDAGADLLKSGLSNAIVEPMGITTLWKISGGLGNLSNFAVMGILGSIVMLITAFVFFAIAIMLVIRYVVLIFVLILSPIYFVSNVLPGLKTYASRWREALLGQAFFAPVYFLLTWVVVVVINGLSDVYKVKDFSGALGGSVQTANGVQSIAYTPDMAATIINFAVIIAFLIISLIIAKSVAGKSGAAFNDLTKSASNFVFGGVVGGALRNTLGRGGSAAANNPNLVAAAKNKPGFTGAASRLALFASKKAASGSFDARNMRVPLDLGLGETKIGRKFNLDKIPRPNIGAYAAGVTGLGEGGKEGFKEIKDIREKKERDIDKGSAEELRKAQNKNAINEGIEAAKTAATARTPAQDASVASMVGIIKKMSEKEIEEQKATTLAIQEVAEALSQKQMDAIEKSSNFSATEVQEIKTARGKRLADAFAAGTGPMPGVAAPATGYETAIGMIRKMSYSDVAKMDEAKLTDPGIFELYTPKFLNKLGRTNELTDTKARAIRTAIINAAAAPGASRTVIDAATWLNGLGLNIF
ncbi:hypothetical protein KW796_02485 [Candidatus Parcubacteria bacterium]|nr:hypothetical protein [Candidatus Parcubacteria bacterium]